MLDAARLIEAFGAGRDGAALDGDAMFRFATLHAIQIIGEAASKVAPEARAAMPGIPWAALVGMRNRLVHAYFDVDTDILWETLKSSVPMLIHGRNLKATSATAPSVPRLV